MHLIQADFLRHDFGESRFDFIGAVASLHHMPFAESLRKMASLLRPAGVISIVGLYRSTTVFDRLVDLAAVPVNAGLAWSHSSANMTAPAIEPTMPLTSVRATAAEILPGCTTGGLLLWRYLLTWREGSRPC